MKTAYDGVQDPSAQAHPSTPGQPPPAFQTSGGTPVGDAPAGPAQEGPIPPYGRYDAEAARRPGGGRPGVVPSLDPNDPRRKNPVLAGILSTVPGLGQIYVGHYPRGFVHIAVVATIITMISNLNSDTFAPLLGFFMAFFWLYNIIDAMRRATHYNQVLAGGDIPVVPDDFKMPSVGGSIFGGASLMVIGFVLLMHTRFGLPLEFIEEWWPLAPMAFGAYLLVKAIRDRAERGRAGGPGRDASMSSGTARESQRADQPAELSGTHPPEA